MRTPSLLLCLAGLSGSCGLIAPATPPAPAPDTSFLRRYAETRGFMLGRPQKPKVTPDGKAVLFLRAEATTPKLKLFEFSVATGETRELLSPESLLKGAEEALTPEEKARRERQRVTVGGFTDFSLSPDGGRVLVKLSNRLYVLDRATGKAAELKTGADGAIVDPKWSPDGKLVGYVRGFDVYAYDLATGKESAVTTGGTEVKTHGLAEFVAQEEMHRHSGFWWSPDSKFVAYEEADHAGIEVWHVADPLKPDVPAAKQFYPRPGKKNVAVKLGVVPAAGGDTVWVEWDRQKYEYLVDVTWQQYGPLTIQVQDRKQQVIQFRRVDTKTGKTDPILQQTETTFLKVIPDSVRFLKDGKRFLHIDQSIDSPVHGRELGYGLGISTLGEPRVGPDGKEVVTGDADTSTALADFRELLAWNPESGEAIFSACAGEVRPFRHDIDSLDPTRTVLTRKKWAGDPREGGSFDMLPICTDPGIYTAAFNGDLSVYAATKTTLKQMPDTTVHKADNSRVGSLPSVAAEPPFVPNVSIQKVGPGDGYWTGVVRPRDFDPKKKYPVVVFTYGGPTSQVVTQAMQPWLVRQWLADQGFVVVAIDNRGTAGRGRDWEKAVYQKFGTVPLEDQVAGLEALCGKFPELDRSRVGVVGWSFGGYMAANAVLRRPDVFRAAVAGAPVTDWADYDTHYTERYMGLLPESKAAYDEASLIPLAPKLERPLLLVHGTADDNVYFRHTLKLADALFRAGREFEVLPLPGVTHMYTADPVVMERLWAKTATFFRTHLGGPK